MNQRHQTTTKLAQTAIFAALCYVAFAFLQIKIPVPGGDATSIHAGNAFFVLKFMIGLIVGLVAHRIAKINESTDKKYVMKWSVLACVAGLGFNVIADPVVGYFYKQYILGQPQQMAETLAKISGAATLINAVVSIVLAGLLYNAVRPVLLKSGLITKEIRRTKAV